MPKNIVEIASLAGLKIYGAPIARAAEKDPYYEDWLNEVVRMANAQVEADVCLISRIEVWLYRAVLSLIVVGVTVGAIVYFADWIDTVRLW